MLCSYVQDVSLLASVTVGLDIFSFCFTYAVLRATTESINFLEAPKFCSGSWRNSSDKSKGNKTKISAFLYFSAADYPTKFDRNRFTLLFESREQSLLPDVVPGTSAHRAALPVHALILGLLIDEIQESKSSFGQTEREGERYICT